MTTLLLKNVVYQNRITDVLIRDKHFDMIQPNISLNTDVRMDCKGLKAILPAFYNGHTHAAMNLLRGYADDLPLFEWLNKYIWPMEARLSAEDIYIGAKLACLEMIRSGCVFFNDMYWHYSQSNRAAVEMGMRICNGPLILDAYNPSFQSEQELLINRFIDAISTFPETVIPSLCPHSVYSVLPETLKKISKIAEDKNMFVHIHLSETTQEVADCIKTHGCSPVAYLDSLGLLSPKTIAAHGIHLKAEDRDILSQRGVILVHMPVSNMKLSNGSFDVPAAQNAGIKIILGTDGASSNNSLDMIREMKFASLLSKHSSRKTTTLPAQTVFQYATRDSARAFGIHAGMIEPGWLADCILVNLKDVRLVPGYNLISDMVYSADSSCLDSVLCNGRFLMKNGVVDGEGEIIGKAVECAQRLNSINE